MRFTLFQKTGESVLSMAKALGAFAKSVYRGGSFVTFGGSLRTTSIATEEEIDPFGSFSEWAGEADCRAFDGGEFSSVDR